MFSPPDALDAAPAGEATTSTTAAPTSESGAYARRTSSDVDAAAATADDADVAGMTGPDLSHLRVPAAGLGLGLQVLIRSRTPHTTEIVVLAVLVVQCCLEAAG